MSGRRPGRSRPLALVCVAALGIAAATAPQAQVPALTGRVVDLADILSPATEATLTERLAAHEDSTTNQIAVLTIPSLGGAVLEEYATEVFRAWGLGTEEANNGVLLLVARDDREIRIEVGYGLEGSVTDARAGRIIRNEMTPRFRDGDFDGGVLAAVDALTAAAEGQPEPAAPARGSGGGELPWPFALLFGTLFGGIPAIVAYRSLLQPGVVARYVQAVFLTLFVWVGSGILLYGLLGLARQHPVLGVIGYPLAVLVAVFGLGFPVVFLVADIVLSRSPAWQARREHERRKQEAFKKARRGGLTSVVVDGRSYRVPTASSGSSSGGGSSFSGGGGSSGGGGASGGW